MLGPLAQQDSRADVRLRAHLHAPPATIIPAEDDDELLDATPDIDVPVSTAVSSALTHLEQAIIETFLVVSRYRYIPNTLGRKRSR